MYRVGEPLIESEVGIREVRESLADLLDSAREGQVIHVVNRKMRERVCAIVSSDVAEGLLAIKGASGPAIPGDLVAVIRMVEGLLLGDDPNSPNLDTLSVKSNAFVGGCITLIDTMLTSPALMDGKLLIQSDSGESEIKLVADILIRKVFSRDDVQALAVREFPLVAGSLWASQLGELAYEYRVKIPVGITSMEAFTWLIALWELCQLVNAIYGDGHAEEMMYGIEEAIRDSLGGTRFERE